jgi:hypothetical protein
MSYGINWRTEEFDYETLRATNPWLQSFNPQGSCFTLSCKWARLLYDQPGASPKQVLDAVQETTGRLMLLHSQYIKKTAASKTQLQKNQGYMDTMRALRLRSPMFPSAANAQPIAVDTKPDPDAGDWMDCAPGDKWCVVFRYVNSRQLPYAGIVSFAGHSIGVFTNGGGIRVFDANEGEFLVPGEQDWQQFTTQLEQFYNRPREVEVIDLNPA